jgi:nitroreductase
VKDFFDIMKNRSSVRIFNEYRLSSDEIEILLKCAMSAPSACDKRPWEFIVVTDRQKLNDLACALPYAKMTAQAALSIIICAVPARAHEGKEGYAIIDASIACEHILLAVEALDLGCVWTALYPNRDREAIARDILGIPFDIIPLALVPIGKPRIKPKAKEKYNGANIHRERW